VNKRDILPVPFKDYSQTSMPNPLLASSSRGVIEWVSSCQNSIIYRAAGRCSVQTGAVPCGKIERGMLVARASPGPVLTF
jgi:hypothetical protein